MVNQIRVQYIVPKFHIKAWKMINGGHSVYTGEMLVILFTVAWIEDIEPDH